MLFRAPEACSYVNSCKATGPLTAIINGNYGTKIDRLLFHLAQHYSVLRSSLRRERNHRLGLVTVPLDVNTREGFIHRLVDITETTHLITTQNLYRSLKHSSLSFIDIDTLPSAPLDMSKTPCTRRNRCLSLLLRWLFYMPVQVLCMHAHSFQIHYLGCLLHSTLL